MEDKAGNEIAKNAYKGGSSFLENLKQELKKGFQDEAKKRKWNEKTSQFPLHISSYIQSV